jgi:hypothetical protein
VVDKDGIKTVGKRQRGRIVNRWRMVDKDRVKKLWI